MSVKAYELAGKLGKILENEGVQESGVALGIVLGTFILLVDTDDEGIDAGIQSIADDAKAAAKRIRSLRQ